MYLFVHDIVLMVYNFQKIWCGIMLKWMDEIDGFQSFFQIVCISFLAMYFLS